jgi:hypothetical protein
MVGRLPLVLCPDGCHGSERSSSGNKMSSCCGQLAALLQHSIVWLLMRICALRVAS